MILGKNTSCDENSTSDMETMQKKRKKKGLEPLEKRKETEGKTAFRSSDEKKEKAFRTLTPVRQHTDCAEYPFHIISPPISDTLPSDAIEIKGPPGMAELPKMNWLTVLATPVGMLLVMLIMYLTMETVNLSSYIFMVPMSLVSVVIAFITYRKQKKDVEANFADRKERYGIYLNDIEKKLSGIAERQKQILNRRDPSAQVCALMTAQSKELWCRAVTHTAFMAVRLGKTDVPICVSVKTPEKSYDDSNPLGDSAQKIVEKYRKVSDVPQVIDFGETPSLGIVGDRKSVIEQTIALIVNATAMHSYEDMKLVLVYSPKESELWKQLRWLPHVYDAKRQTRYMAENLAEAKNLLGSLEELITCRARENGNPGWKKTEHTPHFLVIVADMDCVRDTGIVQKLTLNKPEFSISAVFLSNSVTELPQNCQRIVEVNEGKGVIYRASAHNQRTEYTVDCFESLDFSNYCRTMASVRINGAKSDKEIPSFATFLDVWGAKDLEDLHIGERWKKNLPSQSMRVPLGVMGGREIFYFDDHQDVHGVHGIYVGTNGSGKSSMIRSWILSMAVQFSPAYVNFVLVDFKGSGLLDGLEKLPHVVGTISNLDSNIQRNLTALESEIERREAFFKKTGGNIYSCYRSGNTTMPFLYIVIDELNEFKLWSSSGEDNRMKLLDRLAQVGRALGIQLIAGSQTSSPFTDTMEKNARFRWCLKTATAEDSRYLLKTEDAFAITAKGRAIVRVGSNEVYEEVQPAFSDGAFLPAEETAKYPEWEMALVNLQGVRSVIRRETRAEQKTQLGAVVEYMKRIAVNTGLPEVRRIWPERLRETVLLSELKQCEEGMLAVSVGLVDDPKRQRQYTLQIHLEKNGHIILYGAPQTGKTTFLKTAALSLLSHCSAEQIEVYMLGRAFESMWDCPQVRKGADVFNAMKLLSNVCKEVSSRRRRALTDADKPIIIFIDGIGEAMGACKTDLLEIAQYGAGCRVYLIASAGQCADVISISAYLKKGFALWFSENLYDYRTALAEKSVNQIPSREIRGRGILYDSGTMEFQTALPFRTPEEERQMLEFIGRKYQPCQMPVEVAPKDPGEILLGMEVDSSMEVIQDFHKKPYLTVLGNNPEKRKDVLKRIGRELAAQPDLKELICIDFREGDFAEVERVRYLSSGPEVSYLYLICFLLYS